MVSIGLWIHPRKWTLLDGYKIGQRMPAGLGRGLRSSPSAFSTSPIGSDLGRQVTVLWWMYLEALAVRKKEVGGCHPLANLELLPSRGVFFFPFFFLSLGYIFFFLARSSKMPLLTPLPIKKVDYPYKRGQIGEVMFTILSLDLIGNIGRVSTLGKGWYVLPCVY